MSNSKIYYETLLLSLKSISFDNFSGKNFSFERLFYPLTIEEGRYAFQNHKQLMERARTEQIAEKSQDQQASEQESNDSSAVSEQKKSLSDLMNIIEQQKSNSSNASHRIRDKAKAVFSQLSAISDKNNSENEELSERNETQIQPQSADNASPSEESGGIHNKNVPVVDAPGGEVHVADVILDKTALLHFESDCKPNSLVIDTESAPKGVKSRILAIASAGHGKTTLLKRIAVFYCRQNLISYDDVLEYEQDHDIVKNKYDLIEKPLFPCLLFLRSINRDFDIKKAINNSIADVIKNSSQLALDANFSDIADQIVSDAIINNRLFLLVDGLDELSSDECKKFLEALQEYLNENPDVYVLMTSRVAGVFAESIKSILKEMNFRGRSIIPLNDTQVKHYSETWIDETQPADFRESMKDALIQILNQDRFAYLKEFMRTPLELLFVLKQIAGNSLSLDRYQMFADMLWAMFTNHENNKVVKQYKFEDLMTLLSFIAYRLQLNNKLSFSVDFLKALENELKHLSFHNNMFNQNVVDDCIDILDELAANVGIIESDIRDNEKIYTFTIRSYHEFLTAYACCHLRLDFRKSRPDPQSIIVDYLEDSSWINIINFVLSDLNKHSKLVFDACLNCIFENTKNLELLKSIIESNHTIGLKQVETLCANVFSGVTLDKEDTIKFLIICLRNNISPLCLKYLKYYYNYSENEEAYLNANAIASVVTDLSKGKKAVSSAIEYMTKTTPTGEPDKSAITLGLRIIKIISKICLDELETDFSDKKESLRDDYLKYENALAKCLYDIASKTRSFVAVEALTELWILKVIDRNTASKYLNESLIGIVTENIESMIRLYNLGVLVDKERLFDRLTVLGSFPFNEKLSGQINVVGGESNISDLAKMYDRICMIKSFDKIYEQAKNDATIDYVAVAIAAYYCCVDKKWFSDKWKDVISEKKKSVRVKNHYETERYVVSDYLKRILTSNPSIAKTDTPKSISNAVMSHYNSFLQKARDSQTDNTSGTSDDSSSDK